MAKTIYMSPTGSNSNNGLAPGTPKQTYNGTNGVLTILAAGDTVEMAAGNYTETSNLVTITVTGVTIKGTNFGINANDGQSVNPSRVAESVCKFRFRLDNVSYTLDGLTINGQSTQGYGVQTAASSTNLTPVVRNTIFSGTFTSQPVYITASGGYRIQNAVLSYNRMVDWTTGSTSLRQSVMMRYSTNSSIIGNVLGMPTTYGNITGLDIYDSQDLLIDSNIFREITRFAINVGTLADATRSNRVMVSNNQFIGCRYGGVAVKPGAWNTTIQSNTFTDCSLDINSDPVPLAVLSDYSMKNLAIDSNNFWRNTDQGVINQAASIYLIEQLPSNVCSVTVTNNRFRMYGSFAAGSRMYYGMTIAGFGWDTITVTGNQFTALEYAGAPVAYTYGVLVITNDSTYGVLAANTILLQNNQYSRYESAIGVFNAAAVSFGSLPVGVSLKAKDEYFDKSMVYGVRSGTGNDTDARFCYWGDPSGPSGGVHDPVTDVPADGTGLLVTTDVLFDAWGRTHFVVIRNGVQLRTLRVSGT